MIVKEILWRDCDTHESDLIIEDDNIQMRVYAPYYNDNTNLNRAEFSALYVSDIFLEDEASPVSVSFCTSGSFETTVVCRVKSTKNCIVKIGNIQIELDEKIPSDIHDGDMISFRTTRITMVTLD